MKGKGKSKGFQGTCHTCGQYGHSSRFCSTDGKGNGTKGDKGERKGQKCWSKGKGGKGEHATHVDNTDIGRESAQIGWEEAKARRQCITHRMFRCWDLSMMRTPSRLGTDKDLKGRGEFHG